MRSLAQVLNLVTMVMICLNARLGGGAEIRRSVGVFCVVAGRRRRRAHRPGALLQPAGRSPSGQPAGPLAPLGPGNEVYDVTAYAPPPRANGFYSEPSVAGWFMSFAVALVLAARRLYPILTTLTATICALAAMATLSLTGMLGASIVLAGYVLFVRDRLAIKLFWLALAGSGVAVALYYAHRLGILARFRDIDLPGTSIYFRLTAPYTLITDTLDRFPLGYPLGQTDFIASRHYYVNWPEGSQTNIDNTLFKIIFYFGLLGILFNATYLVQLARYLLLKGHAVGLIMLSLLISLSTTGAGWAHHFVLMIGYAVIVGRYLRARRLLAPTPEPGTAGDASFGRAQPRGRRPERRQQLGLACLGGAQVTRLDVTVAPDLLGDAGDLDRELVIVEAEAREQLLDRPLVVADQLPLGAPLG